MNLKLVLCTLLVLAINIQDGNSARILAIIPTASYSHQMFYQQLWRELAIRGHDMVVVTTDPTNETLPNFNEVSIRESYVPFKRLINLIMEKTIFELYLSSEVAELSQELHKFQLELPQFQEIIQNRTEHFDLLMVEHFPTPFMAIKHHFKCPMIGVVSLDGFAGSHGAMGNPTHPVLYPSPFLPLQGDLTFVQRLISVGFHLMDQVFSSMYDTKLNEIAMEYLGSAESVMETMKEQTDMLFINANPLYAPVRPLTPSTINLAGGIHMKPPKKLPKDLETFLDSASNGGVYLSFGSNVKSNELSPARRKVIMTTLAALPYKVLWKFEDDSLPGKPSNVKITKWAPQQDVLRHPNVKLFITQGGIQSLEEALYLHVPMVVVPFLADQAANAERVKAKQLGQSLSPEDLTVDNFRETILKVSTDPKYKRNVEQLAKQIQDQPMSPLDTAVWWTEYVIRHQGAQHLKGPKIPFHQHFYLDVIALIATITMIIATLFIILLVLVTRKVRIICDKRNRVSQETKDKKV